MHGRRFSKSYDKGPWSTDFDAMAQKTVLKDILSKYAPLSVDMKDALVADNETEDMTRPPIDVTPTETREEVMTRKMAQIEQMKQEQTRKQAEPVDASYPADEVHDYTEETGQGELFFGELEY